MTTLLKVDQRSKLGDIALAKQWWEESRDEVSSDEPPAWHEAVLEERLKAWEEGKETSQDLEEAVVEMKARLGIKS